MYIHKYKLKCMYFIVHVHVGTPLVMPWNNSSRKLLSKTDRRQDKTIHELFIFVHAPMRTYTLEASIRRHLPHKGQCGLRAGTIHSRGEASWGYGQRGWESSEHTKMPQRVCACVCTHAFSIPFQSSVVPQNETYETASAASVRRAA